MNTGTEIMRGFVVGLIFNSVGIILCTFIISLIKGTEFVETFTMYKDSGNLWMIISLGALPNLIAFFGFLRINREHRARGVLMATFVAAIVTYVIYFI